jgi:oligopeptide transport system substrate-binding protein
LLESINPAERLKAAAELQRIIVEEVPLLPNSETSSAYMVHPQLKGVARRVLGQDPDFTYARVVE